MNDNLAILYFQITDIWKRLCEEHNDLFGVTCDEYSLLLKSELDLLDEKLVEKSQIIHRINQLENQRKSIIERINEITPNEEIDSVSKLLEFMQTYEVEKKQKHLFRFNALLIDIIEKIQTQNKRNQLFINKAFTHSSKFALKLRERKIILSTLQKDLL